MGKYGIYLNAEVYIFYLKMDYKVLIYLFSLNRKYKTKPNPSRASREISLLILKYNLLLLCLKLKKFIYAQFPSTNTLNSSPSL